MTVTSSEISFSLNAVVNFIVQNSQQNSEISVLAVTMGQIHSIFNSQRMKKKKNHRLKQALKQIPKRPLLMKGPITRLIKRERTTISTNYPLKI
jgi:phage terminase large subunit-like protein